MDGNTIVKYAGGGLIFVMIYALVWKGDIPAATFLDLGKDALVALGAHAIGTAGRS